MFPVPDDAIELLVAFLNTVDEDTGEEELPDDQSAASWFTGHGLPAQGLSAAEARQVRDALRIAADEGTVPAADVAGVPLHVAPGADEVLVLTSDHPIGPLVVTAIRLVHEDRWHRIKLCDADTCRYAFYDASRNRSARWCSMRVCGNRAKTRAFRERQKN